MILTNITGGLGNQFFQYAAGRCLAERHHTGLLLDLRHFEENNKRDFHLHAFHTNFGFATAEQSEQSCNRSLIRKIKDRLMPLRFRTYYRQPYFHFDKRFFQARDGVYLKGYWQSEKYFLPCSGLIRKELQLKEEYIQNVKSFGHELKNKNSVAVHIRHGDYKDPVSLAIHGILPLSYYYRAMELLKKKYGEVHFYFFSDDIRWVKENIDIPEAGFISGTISANHFEDLYLMSQCRHQVIANSSFSWWAAWLNDHTGKTVIAPKRWFNKGPKDTYDLYPEGWIRI